MATEIHPTAIIGKDVEIGDGVNIGPYTVIEGKVKIGDGTKIGPHCHILGRTTIGKNNEIHASVVIGDYPQDVNFNPDETEGGEVIIGDGNVFREFVTIQRPAKPESKTIVGNSTYFMVVSHIAHDCIVEDNVIVANSSLLAGFVQVHKGAFISGNVGIHQHSRIGAYSIVGANAKVAQDIPPFMIADGTPARVYGINIIGLKRAGFSREDTALIKEMFKILYRSGLTVKEAIKTIESKNYDNPYAKYFLEFLKTSSRGIVKGSKED